MRQTDNNYDMAKIKALLVERKETEVEIEETELITISEAAKMSKRTKPAIAAMMDRQVLSCYLVRDVGKTSMRRMALRSEVKALGNPRAYTRSE